MGRRSRRCLSSGRSCCPGCRPTCWKGRIGPARSAGRTFPRREAGSADWGFPTWSTGWSVRPCGRCSNRCGSRRFIPQATGFRPGRSCHTAIAEAKGHLEDGYEWCVDLDLEKFFDLVCHQRLTAKLAERVGDRRLLVLIGRMLKAKVVLPDGVVIAQRAGRSARRAALAAAVQHRAGRARPRARPAWPQVRSLCGRRQGVRAQRASGAAGDGQPDRVHRRAPAPEGEPGQVGCRPARGSPLPRLPAAG